MFCVTANVVVEEHPLSKLVTLTVYVPGAETIVVELEGVLPAGLPAAGPVHEIDGLERT